MQLKPSSTKMIRPINAVDSMAPVFDLMCFCAHLPKALAEPERLMMDTIIHKRAQKINIRAWEPLVIEATRPPSSLKSISLKATSGFPLAYRSAPVMIPRNREKYTSLVISARTMATRGGKSENAVAYKAGT